MAIGFCSRPFTIIELLHSRASLAFPLSRPVLTAVAEIFMAIEKLLIQLIKHQDKNDYKFTKDSRNFRRKISINSLAETTELTPGLNAWDRGARRGSGDLPS